VASPQPDVDFMRLSRPLDEAITAADLTRSEHKILRAIIRCSYGFGRKDTGALAGYATLATLTGLHRSRISEALAGLRGKRVVVTLVRGNSARKVSVHAINKDYDKWTCLPKRWCPSFSANVELTVPENVTVPESGTVPETSTTTVPETSTTTVPVFRTPEKRVEKRVERTSVAFAPDSVPYRLAVLLREEIRRHTPDTTSGNSESKLQGWARHLDLAIRLDKRRPEEIAKVIAWTHRESDFWRPNIRSGKKVRMKFETLRGQSSRGSTTDTVDLDAIEARIEERRKTRGY